ncbi:YidC/Oxa1 family membrane protein insertase [Acidimicrobiia bacterium EGI L10123]|uniref:YidC/Oxa1 family membrane protein insertase n=1 Tax=Salinilacustrithrix flava TaxID=2957203 RepID=UPI003D7C2DFD|nr:YidC/Oxa1 family membrane protein insertase [Acidimicrobiia bacterium EGI L10123]
MFDGIFEFSAQILNFFYGLVPNYAAAIIMLTLLVMLITTPLTLKGTRSMIKMQLLQPELKKIQQKHKGGDRNEMNQELMAFYQENELNPLGGCFPLLVQAPVFLLLFRLIQGLTRRGADGTFDPKYLDSGSDLYQSLDGRTEMISFGLDLSESTTDALGQSIIHGLPYLALILVMIGAQYLQQKQVSARGSSAAAMPQQQMLLKIMPAFFGVISIGFPAALVVYWVTSSIYRIGLQGYITKSLYGGEDSLGAQARKAADEARAMKEKEKGTGGGKAAAPKSSAPKSSAPKSSSSGEGGSGNGRPEAGRYQPASKKKKRKKR